MAGEYDRSATIYDDRRLPAKRLAAIWRELPERERWVSSWRCVRT
jgi:hypothetical protein